jgi:hypothetical protein
MAKIKGFDKSSITIRARSNWDCKTKESKIKSSNKYKFLFEKFKKPIHDWTDCFDNLTTFQRNILIKGELIRTYDSLPNLVKTNIMKKYKLSKFSSKWYKLESEDKKKLLKSIVE